LLLSRRIRANRPTITFVVLVTLSLASMASGTSGSLINDGLYTAVTVAAYPFWITLDGVKRGADYVGDFVFSYHSARREADELRRELFEAMPALAERGELRAENSRLQAMLRFARSRPELTVLPARVISRSGGILTIDRGAMHGVQEYMCAITKDGVVGVVTRVEPATANVATLHSTDCSIGARIRGSRITGVIKGSGNASVTGVAGPSFELHPSSFLVDPATNRIRLDTKRGLIINKILLFFVRYNQRIPLNIIPVLTNTKKKRIDIDIFITVKRGKSTGGSKLTGQGKEHGFDKFLEIRVIGKLSGQLG